MDFVFAAEIRSLPPGKGRTIQLGDVALALYNVDGEFFAFDNNCPHRGGALGAGTFEDGQVYCPLHAWGFDPKTGRCSNRPDREVRTYPTRVVGSNVEILLQPNPSILPPTQEDDSVAL